MRLLNDLSGTKFGLITVLGKTEQGKLKCRCDCGKEVEIFMENLKRGRTKSCGCQRGNSISKNKTTHGHSVGGVLSREYRSWRAMLRRCTADNDIGYDLYKGRGIEVCDRWRNNFNNFIEDMGRMPEGTKYTIDRIDVNGNYEPQNCKWSTGVEQARNKRPQKSSTTGINGVHWSKQKNKWGVTITSDKTRRHIGYFNNLVDAKEARKRAEIQYWN